MAARWNPVGPLKITDVSEILIYLECGLIIRIFKSFSRGFNVQQALRRTDANVTHGQVGQSSGQEAVIMGKVYGEILVLATQQKRFSPPCGIAQLKC